MKKETFADKLARKSFESPAVQRSWQAHVQAFGPILEPAFTENLPARIHLINALNHISTGDVKTGLKKLELVKKACETDADKAAWLFCMGLCMEVANAREEMIGFYQSAGKYGHRFYLPYLKVAKAAHNDAVFEVAEENYAQAIACLGEVGANGQTAIILGSAYTNYASCLTMMHRYGEAEKALQSSREVLPEQKGRAATEAILAAAMGDAEKTRALVERIAAEEPTIHETTSKMTEEILGGKHPHFAPIALPEGWTKAFWDWFVSNEALLLEKIKTEDYDSVFEAVQPKLKELFPFMERDPEFAIEPKENAYVITLADFFMVSLREAYRELIEAAPASLASRWKFEIAH